MSREEQKGLLGGTFDKLSLTGGAGDRPIGWIDVVNYALSCEKQAQVQKKAVPLVPSYTPDPNMRY